jgi:hypothetical protein
MYNMLKTRVAREAHLIVQLTILHLGQMDDSNVFVENNTMVGFPSGDASTYPPAKSDQMTYTNLNFAPTTYLSNVASRNRINHFDT